MPVESEHRGSDSPYITRIWKGSTSGPQTMTSIATSTWELVFWDEGGVMHAAARGPETSATGAEIDAESDSFGITFAHGASLSHLSAAGLVDGSVDSPRV